MLFWEVFCLCGDAWVFQSLYSIGPRRIVSGVAVDEAGAVDSASGAMEFFATLY